MAFLYYRPISSYLQTRNELGARRAQVVALRAEKARLERRLERTRSDAALATIAGGAHRVGRTEPPTAAAGVSLDGAGDQFGGRLRSSSSDPGLRSAVSTQWAIVLTVES